jgi:type II secretion system protein C
MFRVALLVLLVLSLAGRSADGEVLTIAPADACAPVAPGKMLVIRLPPNVSMREMLAWASAAVCQTFRIEAELAQRTVTVTAPVPLGAEAARSVLKAALAAAGLGVRLGDGALDVVVDRHRPKAHAAKPANPIAEQLKVQLRATMVGADPDRSSALVRDAKGGIRVVGIGERIAAEGAVVLCVEPQRAYFRLSRGKTVAIGLAEEAAAAHVEEPVPASLREAIRGLGAQRFEVARRAVEWAFKNPRTALRLVRIEPELRGGVIGGWRISGFGADSLPARLGAADGDVVTTINGVSLGDPDQALVLLRALKGAKTIVVGVDRQGKLVELTYVIR